MGASCKQPGAHLLIWPCARKSAMSTLQVGQGFMTLRSRMARPVATGLSGAALLACVMHELVSLLPRAVLGIVFVNADGNSAEICCCDCCAAPALKISEM